MVHVKYYTPLLSISEMVRFVLNCQSHLTFLCFANFPGQGLFLPRICLCLRLALSAGSDRTHSDHPVGRVQFDGSQQLRRLVVRRSGHGLADRDAFHQEGC